MIDDKEYDERDKIVKIKANEIESEEYKNDERYQIDNPQSLESTDNKKIRENVDIVDTYIQLYTDAVMEATTGITESQLDNEGLDNVAVYYTENTEFNTSESVERQTTESPVENVDTEE